MIQAQKIGSVAYSPTNVRNVEELHIASNIVNFETKNGHVTENNKRRPKVTIKEKSYEPFAPSIRVPKHIKYKTETTIKTISGSTISVGKAISS
mmetsp:Transcript_2038/g.2617  ORF Transcript_2038/g.2617 Transcript_2038/m.2617 type:complete len:94 (+) Transcript_2038:603-884(+)